MNMTHERGDEMKKVLLTVAVVSFFVLGSLAYGYGSGQMGGCGMCQDMMGGHEMGSGMMGGCGMAGGMKGSEHPMWNHLMGLNLDEQQKSAFKEIKSGVMKDTIKKMADIRIAQVELKDLVGKDPVDMKAVEAKVRQLESMRTEMHLAHIKAMEEVKAKLSPEQKKKFKEMVAMHPMKGGSGMMHDHECEMMKK
jgi:Spy/CpxP family protein refolding chaperone